MGCRMRLWWVLLLAPALCGAQNQPAAGGQPGAPGGAPPGGAQAKEGAAPEAGGKEGAEAGGREGTQPANPPSNYYPPIPESAVPDPNLASILTEIEQDAHRVQPLFGQRLFRQAIVDRFLNTGQANSPYSSPPPSYVVLPGDTVAISFWNQYVAPQLVSATVRDNGTVAFDPVGVVQVSGLRVTEFRELLTKLIRLRGPRDAVVQITFTELHAVRLRVTGAVRRSSGSLVLNGFATLVDALAAAGGPAAYASLRHIRLYRDGKAQTIDLYTYLIDGDPQENPSLRDGDSIHVPLADRLVGVDGEVQRPARYELLEDLPLADLLKLAGGVTGNAAKVQVYRTVDYESRKLVDLDVSQVLAGKSPDLELRHGDQVTVRKLGAGPASVEIQGAVASPGTYGFEPGLTLQHLVELSQGLSGSGYVAVGTISRARPDGEVESINFEVSDLQTGGPAAKLLLQPGDVVTIQSVNERPLRSVVILGAVSKPGYYAVAGAGTLADLLKRVGGLAPGHANLARLISTSGGTVTEREIDLSEVVRGGQPVPNPTLNNGDQVIVPLLTDIGAVAAVRVAGYVRQPGTFVLTDQLTVAQLLERAGGLLPRAARQARLSRFTPGSAETEVVYLDLTKALNRDPSADLVLQNEDLLEVSSAAMLLAPSDPTVSINGAVDRPGVYTRYLNMKVTDLLREAGGLRLEADREVAFLMRPTDNGRTRMIRINPSRAAAGDEVDDLPLQNGDTLEIQSLGASVGTRAQIRVEGAVYNPGPQDYAEGMTLQDALYHARPMPEAYLPRAELRRRGEHSRPRLIPLDLTVKPLNFPLQDGDSLTVYTHDQAVYREPTVEVVGDVQRPGRYERTEDMTVRDLILLAGGPTRDVAFMVCEVSRGRGSESTILRPDLPLLLKNDETQNFGLQDGDGVYLRTFGEYHYRSRQVLVHGEVKLPGHFPLTGEDDRLSHVLRDRAGGPTASAFLPGVILLRRIENVVTPEQAQFASHIYRNLTVKRHNDDIALLVTRGGSSALGSEKFQLDSRILPTDVVQSAVGKRLEAAEAGLNQAVGDYDLLQQGRYSSSESQSLPPSLSHYLRVAVDVPGLLEGRATDISLRPGDIVVVPAVPQLVLVEGEVNSDLPVPYIDGLTVGDYIAAAGGISEHGDSNSILLVRANGMVRRAGEKSDVGRGDVILVGPARLRIPPAERDSIQEIQAFAAILGGMATTVLAISNALN